jgi:hypothetical protein
MRSLGECAETEIRLPPFPGEDACAEAREQLGFRVGPSSARFMLCHRRTPLGLGGGCILHQAAIRAMGLYSTRLRQRSHDGWRKW